MSGMEVYPVERCRTSYIYTPIHVVFGFVILAHEQTRILFLKVDDYRSDNDNLRGLAEERFW
jgi:hypothetical protein